MDSTREFVRRWSPMCDAIARLMAPHAEVVLHDVARDKIAAIWNAFSGRQPGDDSRLAESGKLFESDSDVYGPYPKSLSDGRRLSSVSALLRDDTGAPEAMICINFDRSSLQEASQLLATFAAPIESQPHELFENDWVESVQQFVGDYVRRSGTPVHRLTRMDRCRLLAQMDAVGVFGRRRSIPTVARTLQVSRSSIYNILSSVRKGEVDFDDDDSRLPT